MTKSTFYLIQGFIGAGKTTFSKKLAKENNTVLLNPDEWVGRLFKKEQFENDWNGCFEKTVNILYEKAEDYLKRGINVIFDMGFWLKKDRDFARDFARKCDVNLVHYYLFAPDEILKERIVKSRPENWARKHLENFEKNKKLFQEPLPEENAIKINNF